MADIELVIKIPEEIRNALVHNVRLSLENQSILDSYVKQAIINSTPLPKGHGDLKDIGNLKYVFDLTRNDPIYSGKDVERAVKSMKTIVPEDKED